MQPGCTKLGPIEKELTGKEIEPPGDYFKSHKSPIPAIEQALETATRMLGSDKSQGFCLELICADFLAGAHLENGDPAILLQAVSRMFDFLPDQQKQQLLESTCRKAS